MTFVMTADRVQAREVGQLADAPLRLALVQARTPPVLAFEQPGEVQRVLDALGGGWTVADRQSNREVAVQVGPGGVQQQTGVAETVWILAAPDGRTRAALSATSVTLESDRYEAWPTFH